MEQDTSTAEQPELFGFTVIEAPAGSLPDDAILLILPGPRHVTCVEMPDGTAVERGETLDEYARRCVLIKDVDLGEPTPEADGER